MVKIKDDGLVEFPRQFWHESGTFFSFQSWRTDYTHFLWFFLYMYIWEPWPKKALIHILLHSITHQMNPALTLSDLALTLAMYTSKILHYLLISSHPKVMFLFHDRQKLKKENKIPHKFPTTFKNSRKIIRTAFGVRCPIF